MPIIGETAEGAVDLFVDHINEVLSSTITTRKVASLFVSGKGLAQVSFPRRSGSPTATRLETRFGGMRLLFSQVVGTSETEDQRHELHTRSYAYKLTMAADRQPFVRWEYVKPKGRGDRKCRHHLQGPIKLATGKANLALNEVHLPTGWVTFEEVLRFCIVDLKVTPLAKDWNTVLLESYRRFKEEFAPLGSA